MEIVMDNHHLLASTHRDMHVEQQMPKTTETMVGMVP
jgi:hypothetical protein